MIHASRLCLWRRKGACFFEALLRTMAPSLGAPFDDRGRPLHSTSLAAFEEALALLRVLTGGTMEDLKNKLSVSFVDESAAGRTYDSYFTGVGENPTEWAQSQAMEACARGLKVGLCVGKE